MSELEAFYKIPFTLKALLLGLALNMPFWYLDLYLFSPGMIDNSKNAQIPIIISFCLSASWLFVISLAISLSQLLRKKTLTTNFGIYSMLLPFIILSMMTAISYFTKLSLVKHICITFSIGGVILLGVILRANTKLRKEAISGSPDPTK